MYVEWGGRHMRGFETVDMSYEEFVQQREQGFIDISCAIKKFGTKSREHIGNADKTKNWFLIGEKQFLYKGVECHKVESAGYAYAELIIEELAKKVGINVAFYDLAKFGEEKGVITQNVVEHDGQELISLCSILREDKDSNDIEELMENMQSALEFQNIPNDEIERIKSEFVKRRIFDLFILATDTHTENIALLYENDKDGKKHAKLAPIFDSESSLLLDHTETQMNVMMRRKLAPYVSEYIANVEPTLYYRDDWREQLAFLTEMDGGKDFIEKCQANLNIEEAISNVEKKIGYFVPENIKNFASFVFQQRKDNILEVTQEQTRGDAYCRQIAEDRQKYNIKDFTRILRMVFDEITPDANKKIEDLENS